mgnify:CR=1 FL=1
MNFSVKDGCFGYSNGKQILNNINFSVDEKEILSILGSNGVGKTTILDFIAVAFSSNASSKLKRNALCEYGKYNICHLNKNKF